MTRRGTTETATKIARGFLASHKTLLAAATALAVLYGGVRFVAVVEYERYEKIRKKIGREEFTKYKDRVEKELAELRRLVEDCDERLDTAGIR